MKMDFRKLLKLLNNNADNANKPNLFWKVCVVNEAERRIKFYNNYVSISYVYKFTDGVNGKFYRKSITKNSNGYCESTKEVIDMLANYASIIIDDSINEFVTVSIGYIQILDY